MPSNLEIGNEESPLHLDIEKSEGSEVEFQKWITDADSLELVFKGALCGWQVTTILKDYEFMGDVSKKSLRTITIDKFSRLINESGADYIYRSIYPLISPLESTSKVSTDIIYSQYMQFLETISSSLGENYFIEGNTYKIKWHRSDAIISFLATMYPISLKANEGFTLEKLRETIVSQFLKNQQMGGFQKQEGLIEKFKGAFGMGK